MGHDIEGRSRYELMSQSVDPFDAFVAEPEHLVATDLVFSADISLLDAIRAPKACLALAVRTLRPSNG